MKFEALDKQFLTQRQKYSEQVGHCELWSVIDHWPLYVGIGNLARFMAIGDLLRETLDIPGHIAEFGSWRGANLMFMAKLLRIYDPHGCKMLHCFESFAGLETFSAQDGSAEETNEGAYRGSYDELRAMIELNELDDEVVIHRGDIMETLPNTLKNEGLSFSLIYCDTDLYAPSRLILDRLHSRLSKGGLIVMDEWNYDKWPGEAIAVREFMECHGRDYEMRHVRNARQPSLVLKRVI
jgi:SAM-dependent methyltransferase